MVYNIKFIQNKVKMSIFTKKWYFLAKNDDFYEKSAIFFSSKNLSSPWIFTEFSQESA